MDFKGRCEIIVSRGDKIIQRQSQENIINKLAVERLLMTNQRVFDSNCKICLSTSVPTVNYETTSLTNVVAIGDDTLAGVSGRVFSDRTSVSPRKVIFHNRFLFPNATRTINSIGITPSGTINNNLNNVTQSVYCYLVLDNPIIQDTNDVLNLFYEIYIDWTSNLTKINPSLQRALDLLFLGHQIGEGINYNANRIQSTVLGFTDGDWDKLPTTISNNRVNNSRFSFTPTETLDTNLLKRKYTVDVDLNSATPGTINKHLFGFTAGKFELNQSMTLTSTSSHGRSFKNTGKVIEFNLNSNLTPVYSQSATSQSLIYNTNTLATSDWKPIIESDENFEGLPTVYSLDIENSGGIGVGSYALYKTNYSGTSEQMANTTEWNQRPTPLVTTSLFPYSVDTDREKEIPFNDKWIYRWKNDCFWVSSDFQKVAIWQIYPEFIVFSQWDIGADINDLATDPENDRIYVATESGLFQINTINSVVSTLSTDKAKAVDVGYGGAVFAVLINSSNVGRLASSLNANWSVAEVTTGIVMTSWSNVIFIRVDPTDVDYKMGILEYRYNPRDPIPSAAALTGQWFSRVHWWSRTGGYVSKVDCNFYVAGTGIYHPTLTHPFNSSFSVKNGIWVFPYGFTTGSFSTSNTSSLPGASMNFIRKLISDNPNNIYYRINNQGDSTLGNTDVIRDADTTASTTMSLDYNWGVYQFNTPLRNSNLTSLIKSSFSFPSVAILNSDTSLGYLSIAISGYHGSDNITSSYSQTNVKNCVGILNIAVNPSSPSSASAFNSYQNEHTEMTYSIGPYTGGSNIEFTLLSGNIQLLKDNAGIINFTSDRISNFQGSVYHETRRNLITDPNGLAQCNYPIVITTWGAPKIINRKDKNFSCRYGWDDINSQWVKSTILPGKPLHTATEPLIDGLSIGWQDLDPGSQSNLVAGQFYNFVCLHKGNGLINDGNIGTFQVQYAFYLRPVAEDVLIAGTISSGTYTIPEATSDNMWLCLDDDPLNIVITISGYGTPASIIFSGSPGVNQIRVLNSVTGTLQFNAADEGKTLSGTFWYLKKIHITEVL